MNDIIQEFSEQAAKSIPTDKLVVNDWIKEYNKKFAELVVRECADIAYTAEPYQASDLILKHFNLEGK